MATSGSTDFTVTRDQIIKGALRSINAIATGEPPTSAEISEGSEALNYMIKAWQAEGIGLWLLDTFTLTLVTDQQSYTMGSGGDVDIARPLEVVETRFHYTTGGNEIPMIKWSRQEYFDEPLKSSTGVPTQYYYDPQLGLGVLYIWPTWDTSPPGSIKGTVLSTIEDFDAASNTSDFPPEWFESLKFNLALRLAPEYGKEPSQMLVALALQTKEAASNWDREKSNIQFTIDRRSGDR